MLDVRGITVRAGSRARLEGVGFDAKRGEIVAIIGPNGAGKTTLLEAMVGVRRADSASISFQNEPLRSFADKARTFAYLPDAGDLAPELDVGDLVAHALRFRPRPDALVGDLHDAFRITDLVDMPAGVLSRGERQRVALFCALVVERPVVVLDEPFNAFDPRQLRDVLAAVRRVCEAGATVVMTVHQVSDAEKVADRLLLLHDGRRIAWGSLDALRGEAGLPNGTLEDVFIALLERCAHAP